MSIVPIVLILLETRSLFFFFYSHSLHRVMHPLLLFGKFACFVLHKMYRLIRQGAIMNYSFRFDCVGSLFLRH